MPPVSRTGPSSIFRERERINALHDAIAIIVAEIGRRDTTMKDAIVARLRAEADKMMIEYPPDERGLCHPWPVELSSLYESIERCTRKHR